MLDHGLETTIISYVEGLSQPLKRGIGYLWAYKLPVQNPLRLVLLASGMNIDPHLVVRTKGIPKQGKHSKIAPTVLCVPHDRPLI